MAVQLLAREDLTVDLGEGAQQAWKHYMASYPLTFPTEGLAHRVEQPFLQRTLGTITDEVGPEAFTSKSELHFRVALGNYRFFYTPGTEDYFHRVRGVTRDDDRRERAYFQRALKRLDEFVDSKVDEPEEDAAEDAAASAGEGEVEPPEVAAAAAPAAQVVAAEA